MKPHQKVAKRFFDLLFSILGLVCFGWLIVLTWVMATIDTGKNGLFTQERVGLGGNVFRLMKIRTMRELPGLNTTVTTRNDPRITSFGKVLRRAKIDELPQLINVLLGTMSFVGPRPDVPGFADRLPERERAIILSVRPGITGPATLKFRKEEELLAQVDDPEVYNREVIFPEKARINCEYVKNYKLLDDVKYIWLTILDSGKTSCARSDTSSYCPTDYTKGQCD